MPRHLLALLSLLAVLALGVAVAGCGGDDLNPEAVAEAAEKTRDEGTARIAYDLKASGFAPIDIEIEGKGVTSLDSSEMDVTFELGPLLQMAGQPSGDGAARVVVLGGDVFVDPPAVEGLTLPEDKTWVGVDLARVLKAAGIDAEGLGALMTVTPESSLGALEAAGDIEEVGEVEVDGTQTTHFRGKVRTGDYIETLPAERQEAARKALAELLKTTGTEDVPTPTDVWVDEEGRVRRFRQAVAVPRTPDSPAGTVTVVMTYSDFGTDADVQAPPPADTFDASDVAEGALTRP